MDVDVASLVSLSAWAYLVVAGVVALDAVVPVLPSESAVIVAGVLAADGHLHPLLVVAAAAAGAVAGDGLSYAVGRRVNRAGRSVDDLGGRLGTALRWAAGALEQRGASVISVARFVPGGRTATTAVAGYVGFPATRFAAAAGAGALLWSAYATGIGVVGGTVVEDNPVIAVGGGIAVAVAVTGLVELVRSRRSRSEAGRAPGPASDSPRLVGPAAPVPAAAGTTTSPVVPALSGAESNHLSAAASAMPAPTSAPTPAAPRRRSSSSGVTPPAPRASTPRGSRTRPSTVSPTCTRPAIVRGPAAGSPSDGGPRPVDPLQNGHRHAPRSPIVLAPAGDGVAAHAAHAAPDPRR